MTEPQALEVKSAAEFANLPDTAIEQMIGRPGAAKAAQDDAAGIASPPQVKEVLKEVAAKAPVKEEPATEEVAEEAPRELLTKFAVADKEGELEIPVDLQFSFQANGKEYKDIPIDKVVKMAQMGYYNEEREQQVLAAKQFVAEAQQNGEALQAAIQEYEEAYHRLATDRDYLQRFLQEYANQNTPEAQAQRATQERDQLKEQLQRQTEVQHIATFVSTEAYPRIDGLIKGNPDVKAEEVIGKYTLLTAPLLVNGQVPLHRLGEVVRLIDHDLTSWVEDQQEQRKGAGEKQQKVTRKAQEETALAKRTVARRSSPPSNSGPSAPKQQTFNTAKDWLDAAFSTN